MGGGHPLGLKGFRTARDKKEGDTHVAGKAFTQATHMSLLSTQSQGSRETRSKTHWHWSWPQSSSRKIFQAKGTAKARGALNVDHLKACENAAARLGRGWEKPPLKGSEPSQG